jgi:hypothetical protein
VLKEKFDLEQQRKPPHFKNLSSTILGKPFVQFLLWLIGSFSLGLALVDQFPINTLVVITVAFVTVIALLRFDRFSGAFVFLFLAATPIEGITSQIPFVASLGRYAQPFLSLAFLCLSLISILAFTSKNGTDISFKLRGSRLGVGALFLLPAIFIGWPTSAVVLIQFLNSFFAIFIVITLSRIVPHGMVEILKRSGIAIGMYAALIFFLQNPFTLLANVSADYFIGDASISNPNRLSGLGGDYELFAQFLAVGCVLLAHTISQATGIQKSSYVVLLVASFLVLITTASLYGIVSALIGTALVSRKVKTEKTSSVSFLPLAVVAVLLGTAQQVIFSRLQARRFPLQDLTDIFTNPARVLNRSKVWERVMSDSDFAQVGFLGLGWPFPLERFETYPHSMFLTVFIASGFFGLSFFIFVWLKFVRKSSRLLIHAEHFHVGVAALILLGGNILNEVTRLGSFMIFFVLVLSCVALLSKKREI